MCDQEIPTTTTTKKLCLFNNKKELFFEKGDGIVVALYLGHKALDTSLLSAIVNPFSFYSRIPVGPSEECQPLFCFSVETMSLVPPIRTADTWSSPWKHTFPLVVSLASNHLLLWQCFLERRCHVIRLLFWAIPQRCQTTVINTPDISLNQCYHCPLPNSLPNEWDTDNCTFPRFITIYKVIWLSLCKVIWLKDI